MEPSEYVLTSGSVVVKPKKDGKALVKDVAQHIQGRANEDLVTLLQLCDGTKTVQGITEEISKNYKESRKDIEKKVLKSLEFLKDLNFVHVADQPEYTPVIVRDANLEWGLDMVYLEVTNECNLQCVHCYKQAGSSYGQELSTAEWKTIIDETVDAGVITAAVTGGEPFLRKDIFDILQYLHDNTISVNVFTNGTLLDEKKVKKLQKVNPERVLVSIDGACAETHEKIRGKNTFEKTIESIKMLIETDIKVRTNTVIYTENIDELDNLVDILLDMGVQEMVFDQFMDAGRGTTHNDLIPSLEMGKIVSEKVTDIGEKPQRFTLKLGADIEGSTYFSFCGIGTSMVTIKANGDVVLCPVLSGPEETAGNVLNTPLKEIWSTNTIFQPFRRCNLDDMVCNTCPHKMECRGGCKARALHYYKNVCEPDPWMCATRGQPWPEL
ncbi:MAG: radical SAM protein [Candidatus Methanofastidiosia archaeon]|jgi:radical SAM protein with 4Fe4S-binding SPASM domain